MATHHIWAHISIRSISSPPKPVLTVSYANESGVLDDTGPAKLETHGNAASPSDGAAHTQLIAKVTFTVMITSTGWLFSIVGV